MKKKIIITTFLTIIFVIIIAIILKLTKKENSPNETNIAKTSITTINKIEYGSYTELYDLITIENGEILSSNKKISTGKLGNKEITFEYKNEKNKKKKYKFNIEIIDTTAPIIILNDTYTKYQKESFDLCGEIIYMDNYDPKPTCEIIGEYDSMKIGEYNITMKVTDSLGNVNNKDFTLKVKVDPKTSYVATPYKLNEFIKNHKTDNTMIGIDVSSWQGEIDWNTVKNEGIEFAILRIGFGPTKEERIKIDKYFERNYEEAKKVGMKLGVYFYSYAENENDALEEANWIIEKLNGETLDLGIAFDWEEWSDLKSYNYSIYKLNNVADTFLNEVEKKGYTGYNYGSKNYLTNIWNLNNHKTWLAHYTDNTSYDKDFSIWQISSEGIVKGIDGYVDLNVLYK